MISFCTGPSAGRNPTQIYMMRHEVYLVIKVLEYVYAGQTCNSRLSGLQDIFRRVER